MGILGTPGAAMFTGALLVVAVAGLSSLDAKYAKRAPDRWPAFVRASSTLPVVAIAQRRDARQFPEKRIRRPPRSPLP